jgi:hypothetical protein
MKQQPSNYFSILQSEIANSIPVYIAIMKRNGKKSSCYSYDMAHKKN